MVVLIGLAGAFCLLAALAMTVGWGFSRPWFNDALDSLGMVMILVIAYTTAFYFLYVAYLGWFKLSPTAVNYVCGTWAFFFWTTANSFLIPRTKAATPSVNMVYAMLGLFAFAVAYYAYRAATRYFEREIFLVPNARV